MLVKVNKQLVLNNKELLKERYSYPILLMIVNNDGNFLVCNEDASVIIAQSSEKHPMWIYDNGKLNDNPKEKIASFVLQKLKEGIFDTIVCSLALANEFDSSLVKNRIGMYSQINKKPYCQKELIGSLSKAKKEEIDILSLFLVQEEFEIWGKKVSKEEKKETAEWLIKQPDFYVWRDIDGEIASIAKLNRDYPGIIRINNVFTTMEKRRKGFAGMLVYTLSNMVINEGCMPMLYTDKDYLPSNKSYQNIGYQVVGELVELCFDKNKL